MFQFRSKGRKKAAVPSGRLSGSRSSFLFGGGLAFLSYAYLHLHKGRQPALLGLLTHVLVSFSCTFRCTQNNVYPHVWVPTLWPAQGDVKLTVIVLFTKMI